MATADRVMKWHRDELMRLLGKAAGGLRAWSWMAGLLALMVPCPDASGAEVQAAALFYEEVEPILEERCFTCHGYGMRKGGVALDAFESEEALLRDRDLWWAVLKNVRAGIMPPAGRPRPSVEEKRLLQDWIERQVFGIDPNDPDPGRVTLRRLNRVEYRNTIRDLMGIEFQVDEEFPPDDSGYGFDNIGDVLTLSPLLLEKYVHAADTIVAAAVPTVSKVVQERRIPGAEFRGPKGAGNGAQLTFYKEATVSHALDVKQAGHYRLVVDLVVAGDFYFDPGRCRVAFRVDDRERWQQELAWRNNERFHFEIEAEWQPGTHPMALELHPLTPPDQQRYPLNLRIASVRVEGPLDAGAWVRPPGYERFFFRGEPPGTIEGRREYARDVLRRFAQQAFRRPVDDQTLGRLVTFAEGVYNQPGKRFEEGVAQAMVAVLASPRFLFRVEEADPLAAAEAHPDVDEYALASRLSYFLWSTMPDDELFRLAARGELRKNLKPQVARMLADPRSRALVQNFVGQWLQVRDVDGIAIDERMVLVRDDGQERELERALQEFRARLAQRQAQGNRPAHGRPERPALLQKFLKPAVTLNGPLRQAMRQEAEMVFAHILREDRSVMELIDSDYTFLNERLARHYGISDVQGEAMRRVTLPEGSPRGGVLTQGAVLVVTSNPTRTSPVKRGQFILENILGTPAPPPPPDIPDLEASEKAFGDREPSMREVMALHRSQPLCSSCHSRMDPLGLALDQFNALGMWREAERKQPIDASGRLITGETFHDIRELKRILKDEHRTDFYRCLTEKLLTYALGRGLEYYDEYTVDRVVERLEREQGRISALVLGIIESAPFQKRRNRPTLAAAGSMEPSASRVPTRSKP